MKLEGNNGFVFSSSMEVDLAVWFCFSLWDFMFLDDFVGFLYWGLSFVRCCAR